MNTRIGLLALASLLVALSANTASASCCGAASYRNASCGADPADFCEVKQQCHTVMKTCRKVVWEKQAFTCFKNCYAISLFNKA